MTCVIFKEHNVSDVQTLLENLTDDAFAYIALCDEIFNNFSLFDKTLRHIELCNSVISQIQGNPPKRF